MFIHLLSHSPIFCFCFNSASIQFGKYSWTTTIMMNVWWSKVSVLQRRLAHINLLNIYLFGVGGWLSGYEFLLLLLKMRIWLEHHNPVIHIHLYPDPENSILSSCLCGHRHIVTHIYTQTSEQTFFNLFTHILCVGVLLSVRLYNMCMSSASRDQRIVLDPLELELQTTLSCSVGAGVWT